MIHCVDTYIKVVGLRPLKNLANKFSKRSISGACKNFLKATDCFSVLNIKNIIIGYLNINSLPKKKNGNLKVLITGMLDILIITETKLDNTFPVSQFNIDGYSKRY